MQIISKEENIIINDKLLLVLKGALFSFSGNHYWINCLNECDIKSLNYFDYLSYNVLNVF